MIFSSLRIRSFAAALALASLGLTYSRAQSAPAAPPAPAFSDEPLVIANGTLSHAGKTMPATVQNAVELLRQRYPEANITVIGVENVPIGDLTLNWRRHLARNLEVGAFWREPDLHGVLHALTVAAKMRFTVDPNNDGRNFLLRAPLHEPAAATVRTEVFNLSRLIFRGGDRFTLEQELRQNERVVAVASKRFAADDPRLTDFVDRIATIKAELAETTNPTSEIVKQLLDQIHEVVALTLAAQNTNEKPPAFQYHAGTHLLIATGNGASIQATKQVLAAMSENR